MKKYYYSIDYTSQPIQPLEKCFDSRDEAEAAAEKFYRSRFPLRGLPGEEPEKQDFSKMVYEVESHD